MLGTFSWTIPALLVWYSIAGFNPAAPASFFVQHMSMRCQKLLFDQWLLQCSGWRCLSSAHTHTNTQKRITNQNSILWLSHSHSHSHSHALSPLTLSLSLSLPISPTESRTIPKFIDYTIHDYTILCSIALRDTSGRLQTSRRSPSRPKKGRRRGTSGRWEATGPLKEGLGFMDVGFRA